VRTLFLAHGVRHLTGAGERISALSSGDRLQLRAEPGNAYNSRALLIDTGAGRAVGWVPDWMLDPVHRMVDADPDHRLTVELANGPDTPPHLRLLCRLEARLPEGGDTPPDPDFEYVGSD
jgi:hypothetical protein